MLIAIDTSEIWVEDSDGEGPAVVFLHPGWGDSTIWDEVIRRLPSAFRVLRYDERGYGRSPVPTTTFDPVADCLAVLGQLGVTNAMVVGHSGGGATALSVALADPQLITSLLLLAPGVTGYPWPQDDPYFAEFAAYYEARDHEGLVELGLRTWAPCGGAGAERQIRTAVAAFFVQGEYRREGVPVFDELGRISAPSQLLVGDREYPMVADCGRVTADRIPGCSLEIVDAADHLLPLRAPDMIAAAIRAQLVC